MLPEEPAQSYWESEYYQTMATFFGYVPEMMGVPQSHTMHEARTIATQDWHAAEDGATTGSSQESYLHSHDFGNRYATPETKSVTNLHDDPIGEFLMQQPPSTETFAPPTEMQYVGAAEILTSKQMGTKTHLA